MAETAAADLRRAQRARERLARLVEGDPRVAGVDVGFEPMPEGGRLGAPTLILRVHVSRQNPPEKLAIPEEVDGFPVRIIAADYRVE